MPGEEPGACRLAAFAVAGACVPLVVSWTLAVLPVVIVAAAALPDWVGWALVAVFFFVGAAVGLTTGAG